MKAYRRVQIISGGYLAVYLAALYFSTGVHTGFKLDSDQLIGYVTCGILAGLLGVSAVVKTGLQRKICALLLLLCCGTLLLFARYSVISFNEAFWYFIGVVYLLPVVILVDVVEFMFAGARESADEQAD
ncbi:hypothetical protein [Lactiplantibacillus pentosus]|uniref:hypothetical protein n=1 Tax=Lactiplantibacillus pentosus TaxID=1589 RepID=UPI001FD63551|nr:hypothetical protein [Lactiplantibacillus pentosus]MCJ8181388.1 hypothetical protein [Lactiplantibacillus pentosus]